MKYKYLVFILVISILSIGLIGCVPDLGSPSLNGEEEKNLDYLIVDSGQVVLPLTPLSTLNPLITSNLSYHYFSKLIYEGLFKFNENLEPIPDIASTYTIKNDGKTVAVKIREDVFWHDGEKLTSKDVLYTINVLNSSDSSSPYYQMLSSTGIFTVSGNNIISATIIDDFNIEINFNDSYSNSLEFLTFPIIPSHGFTSNYESALQVENYIPIGTGPYKYVSYEKHKSVNLEANENYRNGKPSIAIVMGKILENEELFLTAYEAGQINITPATSNNWDKYKQNSRVRTIEYVTSNYEFLGFNFSNQIVSGDKGLKLRKAINYGIDRQDIIKKIYLGHATQADVPINPISWLVSEEANLYGYNIEKSREILASVGFNDTNSDGILEDELGNKLSLRLITNPSNQDRFKAAEMIREDLKDIGIELILDYNQNFRENFTQEELKLEWEQINSKLLLGDFDIVLLGWQMSAIPDLSSFFNSNQSGLNNFINYANPAMDSLLTNANNSYLVEEKLLAYNELQNLIVEDLPYISLYYRNKALLIDSKIKGDLNPTFINPYNGLEKCFIGIKSE